MPSGSSTIERARLTVILLTIGVNVVAVLLFSLFPFSNWRTGLALNLFDNAVLILHAMELRDRFMWRLMLFGLVLGFAELPADAWLVTSTGTLDYSIGGGPMIWHSPIWMPLAWEVIAVQFGYLGTRLIEWKRGWGLLLAGLLGAINIPFYEEMARSVKWWKYSNCKMLSHTPYYIILGEFGIVLCLALLARLVRTRNYRWAILAGLVGGLCIYGWYVGAFWVVEKW